MTSSFNKDYLTIDWILPHWDSKSATAIHVLMKQGFAIAQKARYGLMYQSIHEEIYDLQPVQSEVIKKGLADFAAKTWAGMFKEKKQEKSFWSYYRYDSLFKLFSSSAKGEEPEKRINSNVKSSDLNKTKFLELYCGNHAPSITPLPYEWLTNFLGQLRRYDDIVRARVEGNTKAKVHIDWKDLAYCLYLIGFQKWSLADKLHLDGFCTPCHLDEKTVKKVWSYFKTPEKDIFTGQLHRQAPSLEEIRECICEVSKQMALIVGRIQ